MFVGLLVFILVAINSPERAWLSYLLSWFYVLSLSLGGLLFVSLHHVGNAGWTANIRRVVESFSAFLPYGLGLGLIFMIFGAPQVYSWFQEAEVARDPLLKHKAPYLNPFFFWLRFVLFFAIWIGFSKWIVGLSLKQDKTGDESITKKLVKPSVIFILLFSLSYSLFGVDTLMSLEPHWFSTIFGVYLFAGTFQSTLAFFILLLFYLKSKKLLGKEVSPDHFHDLGKYLLGFTIFWAYIAFSQYMLIWYANIPEETIFYKPRSQGVWALVSVLLILLKFVVPFFALLSRKAKRQMGSLCSVALLILVMQYVDLYWLIYPNFDPHNIHFDFREVFIFFGFLGAFLFAVSKFLSKHPLVAKKDPRKHESDHHHVIY